MISIEEKKFTPSLVFAIANFSKQLIERLNHDVGKQASSIKVIDRWSSNKI
jgi:hypothetical protein